MIRTPSPSAIAVVPLEVPPSIRFNSVAVVVTATSSLIFGEVNVLFVTVAVEAAVSRRELPPVLGNVRVFEALSACGAPISVWKFWY